MAVLAELFLILAGFDTSLDAHQLDGTVEIEIFAKAHQFGQRFTMLRDACASRDDPVAKTVESFVVQQYLAEIAEIESETLATLSKLSRIPPGDAWFKSAEIMNRSVDRWQRRFDLALQLLTELDPRTVSVAQSVEEVTAVARLHAGFSDIRDLCNKCIEALDLQWLDDLKVSLTIFGATKTRTSELVPHPCLNGTAGVALLANATLSVRQLGSKHASGVKGLVIEFLDVADKTSQLIDSIDVPITVHQLLPILEKIQLNILSLVRARIMQTKSVQAMLTFLRDILLFGSSIFVDEFCLAGGDASLALDRLCDTNPTFASEVYAYVDPMVLFRDNTKGLEVQWPLSLLFTSDQCIVYCSIHSTFAAIISKLNAIGPGQGAVMHTYQLFLSMLWSEFQIAVDAAFVELRKAIDADQDLTVQSTQSRILKDLVRRMFLDSSNIRAQLHLVLENVEARSDSLTPVRDLAMALSILPFGRDLPLKPFIGIGES